MPKPDADALRRASLACAYIAVTTQEGDAGIGSAFHIGDGYYVTAKHVLDRCTVDEFCPYNYVYLFEDELRFPEDIEKYPHSTTVFTTESKRIYRLNHETPLTPSAPYVCSNSDVDVAIIKVDGVDRNTPALIMPPFLDEAVGSLDFVLEDVTIFGYPPIPFSDANFVIATGEVNAVIDTRLDRFIRFIISAAPRGGFSGGPALLGTDDFLLGVITQSFSTGKTHESDFMSVTSADMIRECVDQNSIHPLCQMEYSSPNYVSANIPSTDEISGHSAPPQSLQDIEPR